MNCPNCQQENDSTALFCQNCGNRLKIRCPNCETANVVAARFCMNCGHQLDKSASTAPRPDPHAPPAETTHSERRVLTILFADIKGSTALAEKLDPEEWTEIMNATFDRMTRAVMRYDGTVARLMGDAILALFGAPHAHEDDPFRAVLAALDMLNYMRPYQEEIREQMRLKGYQPEPTDFDLRIGINTGLAIFGEVGKRPFVEYTAMGDAVNVAARMEQAAEPGTVLLSHDTYRLVAHQVEALPLGAVSVKGKREPLDTYRLLGLAEADQPARGISTLQARMIGRDVELSRLKNAAEAVRNDEGRIISLIGEAGLGKSRLVSELHAAPWRSGTEWIEAVSLSFETSQPYGLLKRLMQQAMAFTPEDTPENIRKHIKTAVANIPADDQDIIIKGLFTLFSVMEAKEKTQLDAEDLQRALIESIRLFWKYRSADKPIMLVLDDLHWADPASVDVVLHMSNLVEQVPILLLCIYRPERLSPAWKFKQHVEDKHTDRHESIYLHPLSAQESNVLVSELLKNTDLKISTLGMILQKAEGNPFFVEEIVHELVEKGSLVFDSASESWQLSQDFKEIDIPDSLDALLVSRLDRLDAETRRTAQLAAVIGRSFYYRVLQMVGDKSKQLDEDLQVLQNNGLILEAGQRPELEFMFRHVLTQEAAYNTILLSQRRQFHQQTGEVMERLFDDRLEEHAPLLAHHFMRAEDHERAFRYFSMAGESAANLFANSEAIIHYQQALEIAPLLEQLDPTAHMRLLRGRGLALDTQGKFNEALQDLEHALQLARENDLHYEEWRCLLDIGMVWSSRDYTRTGEVFQEALSIARHIRQSSAIGTSLNRLGNWHINQDQPRQALQYHKEALKIFQTESDEAGIAETLDLMGMTSLLGADPVSSVSYYRKAIGLFEKLGNQPGLISSLTGLKYRGPNHQSKTVFPAATLFETLSEGERELELAHKINWKAGESWAAWGIALVYGANGRFQEALERARYGIQIADEIQHLQWMAGGHTAIGSIYLDLMDYKNAIIDLTKACKLGEQVDSINWVRTASGYLALAYTESGDYKKAEALLQTIIDHQLPMETVGQRNCWWAMADLKNDRGDYEAGLEIVDRLIYSTLSRPENGIITQLWKIRADALIGLGRLDEAHEILKQAIENGQNYGEHPLTWRLYAALSKLHRLNGRQEDAQEAAAKAHEIVSELSRNIEDSDMAETFRTHANRIIDPPAIN